MKVALREYTDIKEIDHAIGLCWAAGDYENDKAIKRIQRVALQNKHESVLEFVDYIFDIEASTKVLLEMTRHRIASYAAQSSRYTLNKVDLVFESTGSETLDMLLDIHRQKILELIESKEYTNDQLSLMLPQAYQYKWTCKFNARSLKNFLELRRNKTAHFHIRAVAEEMYSLIPEEHKFIFTTDGY